MCINGVKKSGIAFEKWNAELLKYDWKIVNIDYKNAEQCQVLEKNQTTIYKDLTMYNTITESLEQSHY